MASYHYLKNYLREPWLGNPWFATDEKHEPCWKRRLQQPALPPRNRAAANHIKQQQVPEHAIRWAMLPLCASLALPQSCLSRTSKARSGLNLKDQLASESQDQFHNIMINTKACSAIPSVEGLQGKASEIIVSLYLYKCITYDILLGIIHARDTLTFGGT